MFLHLVEIRYNWNRIRMVSIRRRCVYIILSQLVLVTFFGGRQKFGTSRFLLQVIFLYICQLLFFTLHFFLRKSDKKKCQNSVVIFQNSVIITL